MNRRSFIGSVIGMAAALQFRALLPDDQVQISSKLPFRMLFKGNGHIIQAPGIEKLVQSNFRYTFVCEQLHVTRSLEVDRCILLDDRDRVIREAKFVHTVQAVDGDILNVCQVFDCYEPFSREEFIKALVERKFDVC